MLTEETIERLKALINGLGGDQRDALLGALNDVGRVIGSQALLIRNMKMQLDNARVGLGRLKQTLDENSLKNLFAKLGTPKRNSFTLDDAVKASEDLVTKVNQATDFADIFKAVVQVAKVFI